MPSSSGLSMERPVNVASRPQQGCKREFKTRCEAPYLMADRTQREQTGAGRWSTDALVWAAIRYLDSPTDYREHLPFTVQRVSLKHTECRKDDCRKNNGEPLQKPAPQEIQSEAQKNDFVLLDNIPDYWWPRLRLITLVAFFLCMLLLVWMRS